MKFRTFIFLIFVLLLENLCVVWFYKNKYPLIKGCINNCFNQSAFAKSDIDSISRNVINKDIHLIQPLKDDIDAWYTKYHVVAHAGGFIDGLPYSNCKEAWDLSYNKGVRVFDADLIFSSDSILVARHSWLENLETTSERIHQTKAWIDPNGMSQNLHLSNSCIESMESFKKKFIYGKYTPMSIYDVVAYMNSHLDLYVSVDMKDDDSYNGIKKNEFELSGLQSAYLSLYNVLKQTNSLHLISRIIVNIYKYEDYDRVKKVFPFQNCVLRQHSVGGEKNYLDIASFCKKNDIHVVNISCKYIEDPGISILVEKNIHVMVAIVDYMSDMDVYLRKGITMCVSNRLSEVDFDN